MKSCLDKDFKYTPSYETDVKKTVARVRKQMEEQRKQVEANQREVDEKVKTIATRRA